MQDTAQDMAHTVDVSTPTTTPAGGGGASCGVPSALSEDAMKAMIAGLEKEKADASKGSKGGKSGARGAKDVRGSNSSDAAKEGKTDRTGGKTHGVLLVL